ncbi:hypothetical protein [Limnobacter litoralis]|uniref:Uncharacterized protein n=1 Tax=Limnobacter litoralis TaxID=481366 RepID=A0ABQ5YNI8_9BURK|nr:hypothetical protein [Limnobacter litoralis]GLR26148.1 hypothetical protein GCM10007875_12360 [Limnobacter litoralis]
MQNYINPASAAGSSSASHPTDIAPTPATGPIERPVYFSQSASFIAQHIVARAPFLASHWRQLAQYMLNREASLNSAVFAQVCLSNQSAEAMNATGAAVIALQLHPQSPENWDTLANIIRPDEFIPLFLQGQHRVYSGESLRQVAALLRQQSQTTQT